MGLCSTHDMSDETIEGALDVALYSKLSIQMLVIVFAAEFNSICHPKTGILSQSDNFFLKNLNITF